MKVFDTDEKGNVKLTTKNTIVLFGGIFALAFIIYKVFPKEFKNK